MTQKNSAPTWFTVVAVLALLWNLLGVVAYLWMTWLMPSMMTPEALEALPEVQRTAVETQLAMQAATPAWATAAFALAVFGGLLGSLLLLMKKNLAISFFVLSLLGLVGQNFYAYAVAGSYGLFGMGAVIQSALIIAIALFLLWVARKAKSEVWSV